MATGYWRHASCSEQGPLQHLDAKAHLAGGRLRVQRYGRLAATTVNGVPSLPANFGQSAFQLLNPYRALGECLAYIRKLSILLIE